MLALNQSYIIWNTIIFISIAILFLFPSNKLVPIDRRLAGLLGASCSSLILYCYPIHAESPINNDGFSSTQFPSNHTSSNSFSPFEEPYNNVLVNVNTERLISNSLKWLQNNLSFWKVSLISFIISPFITNDGLCLILVMPVLDAFVERTDKFGSSKNNNNAKKIETEETTYNHINIHDELTETNEHSLNHTIYIDNINNSYNNNIKSKQNKANQFYFMLAIACSANIGSVMTYCGNPQNIIVAQHLNGQMTGASFFMLMFIPAIIAWVITTSWLDYNRKNIIKSYDDDNFAINNTPSQHGLVNNNSRGGDADDNAPSQHGLVNNNSRGGDEDDRNCNDIIFSNYNNDDKIELSSIILIDENKYDEMSVRINKCVPHTERNNSNSNDNINHKNNSNNNNNCSNNNRHQNHNAVINNKDNISDQMRNNEIISSIVSSSSWIVFPLFLLLIILEFMGTLPLAGIFSIIAILMLSLTIISYYYSNVFCDLYNNNNDNNNNIKNKIKNITDFIEDIFVNRIDYNLIIIFVGLFIVSGSFIRTGIPALIWSNIASLNKKKGAFQSVESIIMISIYVIILSQLIGNVPVIYMAQDDIDILKIKYSTQLQGFGWLLMAWISTIAGNFTLAGSAANIIVAEKALRYPIVSAQDITSLQNY
eukprot:gene8739-11809_t